MAAGCVVAPVRVTVPSGGVRTAAPKTIRVQVREGTALVVREVALEDYVAATALSEVHPDAGDDGGRRADVRGAGGDRAHLCGHRIAGGTRRTGSTSAPRPIASCTSRRGCATSRWAAVARAAVQRTAGEVLWFADAPARAVFHADCGGHTSSAAAVWGGVAPAYLSGADRQGTGRAARTPTGRSRPRATALRAALNADPRTAVGAKLDRHRDRRPRRRRPRREDPAARHADVRRPRRGVPRGGRRARSASGRCAARSSR